MDIKVFETLLKKYVSYVFVYTFLLRYEIQNKQNNDNNLTMINLQMYKKNNTI